MTRTREIFKVTIIGSVVNVLLLVLKFVAGVLGHSSAMVADAVHSLSDFLTDIVVLVFVTISGKPNDKKHEYGHGKFEILAMTIIGFVLVIVAVGIISKGVVTIDDFFEGQELEANAWHHRSDALSSIGTLVGVGGAIFLGQKWVILDPIASVVVGVFIGKVAFELLRDGIGDLTDKATEIENLLRSKYGKETHVAVHVEPF